MRCFSLSSKHALFGSEKKKNILKSLFTSQWKSKQHASKWLWGGTNEVSCRLRQADCWMSESPDSQCCRVHNSLPRLFHCSFRSGKLTPPPPCIFHDPCWLTSSPSSATAAQHTHRHARAHAQSGTLHHILSLSTKLSPETLKNHQSHQFTP